MGNAYIHDWLRSVFPLTIFFLYVAVYPNLVPFLRTLRLAPLYQLIKSTTMVLDSLIFPIYFFCCSSCKLTLLSSFRHALHPLLQTHPLSQTCAFIAWDYIKVRSSRFASLGHPHSVLTHSFLSNQFSLFRFTFTLIYLL